MKSASGSSMLLIWIAESPDLDRLPNKSLCAVGVLGGGPFGCGELCGV